MNENRQCNSRKHSAPRDWGGQAFKKLIYWNAYHGNAHEPANIFIHAPLQRVLMVIDAVFSGWTPRPRFALTQEQTT